MCRSLHSFVHNFTNSGRSMATVVDVLIDTARYVNGLRNDESAAPEKSSFHWVGFAEPTSEELSRVQEILPMNHFAIEDALGNHQRSKLDQFAEHTFLVVRTVAYNGRGIPLTIGDLCIFVSDSAVVTVRHGAAMPLATIRADLESRPQRLALGPTAVVHELIDRLVDQYVEVSNRIAEDVRTIEDSVFDDDVPALPQDIYAVKRELIEFRRAAAPLLEPLTKIVSNEINFLDPQFTFDFSDIRDHLLRVLDLLDALDRVIDAALQANLALLSVKQNEDMRKISAWVGIVAVPTMIAGIYGMNFENMPELQSEWGYFVTVGFMCGISFVLYRLFRKNNWL